MNFHIATDRVRNAHLYGPLAHNSAFIGENLNFTLSKTYVASNSARFSILFYDMSQLYDIYGMGELKSSECICGNYVLKNQRDYVMDSEKNLHYLVLGNNDSSRETISLKCLQDRNMLQFLVIMTLFHVLS